MGEDYVDEYFESQQVYGLRDIVEVSVINIWREHKNDSTFDAFFNELRTVCDRGLVNYFSKNELIEKSTATASGDWFEYTISILTVQAKVFDNPSPYGINSGRISKLSIFDSPARYRKLGFFNACLVSYNRGWHKGLAANTPLAKYLVNRILLEHPTI